MFKQCRFLPGLLSASLLIYTSNVHAQESVSSFEQSINNNTNKPAGQSQPDNTPKMIPANYDMKELAEKLEKRGWDIQHKKDGSLILVPKTTPDNQTHASTKSQWQQLQEKFQNSGWTATIDQDGSMHLTPPDKVITFKQEDNNQTGNNKTQTLKNSSNLSFKKMQNKLQANGWVVRKNSDGSVLLYPPELSAQKKTALEKVISCPGIKISNKVPLPINSWQKAHDIAQSWLNHESISDMSVGKIRKIFNVYIISIVADKAPFNLKYQIAIKNSNGAVIVLN